MLKEYITQGAHKLAISKPPQAVTNVVSWRPEGIKYKKNEVFLDVVERLNCLVAANGSVISSEILGSVKMKCQLTGMPELKLGLNDKAMFEAQGRAEGAAAKKAVELEDIKFHQCVRLTRFESDRTISFIPPDGEFELMSYRLQTAVKPLIWVETVIEAHGRSRVEYMVKMRSQFKPRSYAKEVEIFIPVPPDVDSPAFRASQGSVTYVPDLDAIKWTLHQFHGGKEAVMRAHFGLPSVASGALAAVAAQRGARPRTGERRAAAAAARRAHTITHTPPPPSPQTTPRPTSGASAPSRCASKSPTLPSRACRCATSRSSRRAATPRCPGYDTLRKVRARLLAGWLARRSAAGRQAAWPTKVPFHHPPLSPILAGGDYQLRMS